jgi:hypothetical protein
LLRHRWNQGDAKARAHERLDRFELRAAEADAGADVSAVAKAHHLLAQTVTLLHHDDGFVLEIRGAHLSLLRERMPRRNSQ